ncbi:hypothetical protein GH714_033868 [Hevea brasiliensis]|uniref:R13L1/DRL21-like LRR repeat region domain-containing protein n=1 Tax=Hevea brasiliensis TaxID=3981 RepID=A0A6A6L5M1_HEVBR|nr:hypothetical protein GH714_033868 [Hevea brasiliensis]
MIVDYKGSLNFEIQAWDCVSEEFDVLKLTKVILEEVTGQALDTKTPISSLNQLQLELKRKLEIKKFLLVLDDVWSDKQADWEILEAPLKFGGEGSKIVVTTRNEQVALAVNSVATYHLTELSVDESLGKLQHLRELGILNLQNVVSVQDALEANLKNKKCLKMLKLNWAYLTEEKHARALLGQLQPQASVEQLIICRYGGTRFPDWVGDSSFSNLVSLKLDQCKNRSCLPSLGHLESLKDLSVTAFDGVSSVGPEFYFLFPSLTHLKIVNCPEVESFLAEVLPLKLESLEICHCN